MKPIYFSDIDLKFTILGKAWAQKNNLNIFYKNPYKKLGAFIDHSEEMKVARVKVAEDLYKQYQKQGKSLPIDYLIAVNLVFYVKRHHEPDLDNLPAFILDAMQGISVKGCRSLKVAAILENDKLVREEHSRKIVEGDIDYDGEPRTEIRIQRYGVSI